MSLPCSRHASRIVAPAGALTGTPSMVISTILGAFGGGAVGIDGDRAGRLVKMTGSTPV